MKIHKRIFVFLVLLTLSAAAQTVAAQSSDQSLPTAVLSNEINGTIAALDLGDPRLTRHFYAFEGVPGDLVVRLDSRNLNGDVDIFTAVTFRPLIKISMYANTASPQVTKSFYLRSRQILILRVEARTPNDESGSYHIRFSGAFEPFSGGIPVAENSEQSTETATERKTNVSSVGARIKEPTVAEKKPTETPSEETATNAPSATKPKSTRGNPRRTPRGRAARSTRNKPASTGTEAAKTEAAKTEVTEEKKEAEREEKSGIVTVRKPSTPANPVGQETAPPQRGAHLIIEQKDGTRIDRPMTTVRRVVIEGGVIVVVLRSGRIERVPMSAVTRMSIEP